MRIQRYCFEIFDSNCGAARPAVFWTANLKFEQPLKKVSIFLTDFSRLVNLLTDLSGFLLFQGENSPLNKVRRRILILLGSLGGKCNLGLLGGREGGLMGSNGIAWDTRQHLSFALPFQDMKPNIYLGRYHIRSFGC